MADTIVEPVAVEPVVQEPQAQPEGNVAPNLDSELDAALNKAFSTPDPEPKPEKLKNENPKAKEITPKEEAKEKPKASPEEALPNPDTLDAAPSKKQDGWNALRNNYKRAHKLISDRDAEITKLKSGLAERSTNSTKEVEGLKQQIEELSKYRTMIDIQADPEFISKYDQPLEKAKGSIKEMLMGMNVTKEVVEQLDFNNTKLMDEITGYIEEHRDKFQAKKFQRKVEEVLGIMEKRDETLTDHKKNYSEFMENKKKESSLKGAENEGRMIKHLEMVAAAKDKEGNVMFPFLSKMTPKDGAPQGEIDHANNHNQLVEVMQKRINEAIKYDQPEQIAELAVAAVSSHYLTAQLKAAVAKIKSLEGEVSKISTISTDTERNKPRNPTGRNGSSEPVDLDTALANHFSR